MIWVLLIISAISGAISAPTDVNQCYNIVVNDNRTENLRKYPFVAECKEHDTGSKSLCYAIYDVALSFNSRKLDFETDNVTYDKGNFCEALKQVLPDRPYNNDSFNAFDHLALWIKDKLTKKDGEDYCKQKCFFTNPYSYEKELLPACQFIFNQYSVLKNQSSEDIISESAKSGEIKTSDVKSSEPEVDVVSKDDPNHVEIVPASAKEALKNSTINTISSPEVSNEFLDPKVKSSNETVSKQESSAATAAQEQKPVVNVTDALSKPVVQTTAKVTKKPIVSNDNIEVKIDEPFKSDEPNLGNNVGINDDEFGINGNNDIAKGNVDDDGEPDQDEEDYYVDHKKPVVNDGNEIKMNGEPDPTFEDIVPKKKVEVVDFQEDPDSNFFTYLCGFMFLCVLLYILHQNRHKILACFLEGRRGSRRGRERSRGGSKAAYSKLDCNLEEAITSKKSLSGKSMDIIY